MEIINLIGNQTVKGDDVRERVFSMTVTGFWKGGKREVKTVGTTLKN